MIGDGNLYQLLTPLAAFTAGAVVSLHCVGMCGPLSCPLIGHRKGASALHSHALYHLGRVISYSFLGALAGALGGQVVGWVGANPSRLAPWAMVAFFLALAVNLDGLFTRWQAQSGIGRGLVQRAYRVSGHTRGMALGLLTPFIPCGPLYLMLWTTTMSGSALHGFVVMASFAAGSVPLMLLAQSGWVWMSLKLNARRRNYIRRGIALLAVVLLYMRVFIGTEAEAIVSGANLCD